MKILIDGKKEYQTFEGFGASGAWWAQLVGGWESRDTLSRLLFSKKDGIGLRTYRYNIGAGSAESGRGNIENPLRRTQSFEIAEGVYDFTKDANAVAMMKQAVRDGAEEVILFVNSPPERLTKNHKAHLDPSHAFRTNLDERSYGAFVTYCLDITEHFVKEGVPVKYLSPINEPVWVWTGGQEGCHYSPRQAGRLLKRFAEEMEKRPALKDVKLSGVESGDLRWLNKSYTRALLRDEQVRKRLDGVDVHSYCLPLPLPLPFLNDRAAFVRRFRKYMDKRYPGVPIKMSEWCHMQGGRDRSMKSALVMAKVMAEDIGLLNVTSWQHWIALSEVDYCDGLIYIYPEAERYELTKRYFVTGNFSKYIPCGAKRIEASCDDAEIRVLAFRYQEKTTLIVINPTERERTLTLPRKALFAVTDKDRDLEEYSGIQTAAITAESVNTFVF